MKSLTTVAATLSRTVRSVGTLYSYADAGLSEVPREVRLFTLLDALLFGGTECDKLLVEMLGELDALHRELLSASDASRVRVNLMRVGPYEGMGNSSMRPEERFKLCVAAVADPDLAPYLRKICTETARLSNPIMLGLAQVVALYQNVDEVFRERYGMGVFCQPRIDHIRATKLSPAWYLSRSPYLKGVLLNDFLHSMQFENSLPSVFSEAFDAMTAGELDDGVRSLTDFACLCVWTGQLDRARVCVERDREGNGGPTPQGEILAALIGVLTGETESLSHADAAFALLKKQTRSRSDIHVGFNAGLVRDLCRFLHGTADDLTAMREDINILLASNEGLAKADALGCSGLAALCALDYLRSGRRETGLQVLESRTGIDTNFLSVLFYYGARIRYGIAVDSDYLVLRTWYDRLSRLPLLRALFADLLRELCPAEERQKYARGPAIPKELVNFAHLVPEIPAWQMRLAALESMVAKDGKDKVAKPQGKAKRLVWVVSTEGTVVEPLEQTMTANGRWSKGRAVSLKRLSEHAGDVEGYSEHDARIVECIEGVREWWEIRHYLRFANCCRELEAHPYVYRRLPSGDMVPTTVRRGHLGLRLKEGQDGQCLLTLADTRLGDVHGRSFVVEYDKDDIVYYELNQREIEVASILGVEGLTFPKEELQRVLMLTRHELNIPMETEIDAEDRDPDNRPVIQMEQADGVFRAVVGVRPLGEKGTPFYPVGEGAMEVLAALKVGGRKAADGKTDGDVGPAKAKGRAAKARAEEAAKAVAEEEQEKTVTIPVRVRRNFAAEHASLSSLARACPALERDLEGSLWSTPDAENLLCLLDELRGCGQEHSLEWPRGKAITLSRAIPADKVSISIKKGASDWFGVSGEVELDENKVLSIRALLSSLKGSRFVQLGDGEYIALTEDLRRRLSRLKNVLSDGRRNEMLVSSLAAGTVEDCLEGMNAQVDEEWTHSVERMHEAFATKPRVPSMLKAELRDYQHEGYVWMQRLAKWGVGACLADDMGLGKTLQTIAVMINEAKKGPCLVLAPASVCGNWEAEIVRFAPHLTVRFLSAASDRKKTVDEMERNEVLVVGYGLLVNVGEELASRTWSMVVFDEAQALKNANTKRSKAVCGIPADFRVALTGTPIENRIDDLWSIFNTINPGLLGSYESFRRRFGSTEPGTSKSKVLRSLVRPFLLRRLKSAVLDELPQRTEQNILITPNDKERAVYEAIRREAVESVGMAGGGEEGGNRRFLILTALTRLRRCCCHPGLANPDMMKLEKTSSKTDRCMEIIEELVGSGHKVLAFSQFTTYLAQIEKVLKARGIAYQYLDGSTPEKLRRKHVAAFQAGEGDVFLLSLKAGGTGINLTAADYVIHLDPWWNPAVEDQASDRAHRMGQKRPVTVYRLVMKDTVEEKILDLHHQKRELAAEFLEGAEGGVKPLSEEELLALLG